MIYKIAFSRMQMASKLAPGDPKWPEFNGSFDNLELVKSDIAGLIYDGHPFTTWHANNWRHSKNYQLGQHLALDFDAGDIGSSIPHLVKDKFIQRYAMLVYSTPSSTPETPKSRVLFVLDTPIHQPRNYVLAIRSLLWLFGTADEKCKDPCRFFYGSLRCETEFINQVLPLDKVKELIGQYLATGAEAKRQHANEKPVQVEGDAEKLVRYWQKRMAEAREGERNSTLNKAAYSLAELVRAGAIRKHEVYDILEPAALRTGLEKSEVGATIASGLRAWGA